MRRATWWTGFLLLVGCASAPQPVAPGPGLGTAIAESDVAAWDIDVRPDGLGLPPGSGSAKEGEPVYAARCAHCHGLDGTGGPADALAGDGPTVGRYWPHATTLFDYLRRAMPYEAPGSLTNDELYALTAHVLHLNGIVERSQRLDRGSLPAVVMPNRDGFRSGWQTGSHPPAR